MYHYVYRVEHIETRQFYIGSRSSKVHPTLDSYLGSMRAWKPDKSKLKKEILKDDFVCREDANKFEAEEITKFIEDPLNENYHVPGIGFHTKGTVCVKDANGNIFQILSDDPRYTSGELVGIAYKKVAVVDIFNNELWVNTDDPRYVAGELKSLQSLKKGVRFECEKLKGKVNVVTADGTIIKVSITDANNYAYVWSGRNHTEQTKEKMRSHKGKQTAEKNSQFGTMWIHNVELKQNKKIKIADEIPFGWIKGRKINA